MDTSPIAVVDVDAGRLRRRAVALAWLTVARNAVEAVAALALREGREAWRGDTCCD